MKDTELKRMRDEALYQVYLQGLEEGAFVSMQEAAEYVSSHEAPQFFIEAKQVSLYIGMIENHISLIFLNSASWRRVRTLYAMYLKWREEHPESQLTRERVCEILVGECAPEFYLMPESARIIIQRMRRERRDKAIRRFDR